MTTIELKKELINRIAEINDITFLKAIKTILDSKTKNEILIKSAPKKKKIEEGSLWPLKNRRLSPEMISLTSEQKDEIFESRNEIKLGLYTNQEQLDKEIMEWIDRQ